MYHVLCASLPAKSLSSARGLVGRSTLESTGETQITYKATRTVRYTEQECKGGMVRRRNDLWYTEPREEGETKTTIETYD